MNIAIVGAGISGLYLAWKLSRKGHQVVVFEKRDKIGKEVCSGLFSQRILDFIPESEELIQNQIKGTLIHFPKKTLKVLFKKEFLVMDHYQLDNLVAELARKSGAEIVLNKKIDDFPEGFDRIIGSDGPNSIIRKRLNLLDPQFFLSIQGFLEEQDNSNYVETWPTDSGFAWRIPRGREVEYGIMESPAKAKEYFENFLKERKIFLKEKKAAIIPQVWKSLLPKDSKVTLCGDATGLTKPWSGGGVVWSLISADMLLHNFPNLIKYRNEVNRFFLPEVISSKIIKKLLYFFGKNLPWFLPKKFDIDGDFLF